MDKILWVDTETTGVDHNVNGLIQFAAIVEIDGVDVDEININIQPFGSDKIDSSALCVTGISVDELKNFDNPKKAWMDITRTLSIHVDKYDRRDKFTFAGFNATFDMNFMYAFSKKCGDNYCGSWLWYPPLDVAVIAGEKLRKVRHELTNFKLGMVAEYLGIKPDGELHDAMTDIRLTREVYRKIITM